MVSRSALSRIGRLPSGCAASATAASKQPDETPADDLDVRPLEQIGPVVEPQLQRLARLHDQRQRIMRRIAAMDLAELQAVACCAKSGCGKSGAVDRIVLEHQQRVEQIADAGRLLDLGQAEMLMRHQPRLAVLGLPQQRRQRKLAAAVASAAAAC